MQILYVSSKKNWGGVTNWMSRTALGLERRGHPVWIIAHPKGRFVRSASQQLKVVPVKLGMDYNPGIIFFIYRFIKKHQIDVVVTNIEKEIMVGGVASRLAKIPNVRRVGREDDFNERLRVKWHHRLLVDRCIVPCNLIRDNAKKRASWLDTDIFETIYNGRNLVGYTEKEICARRNSWGLSEKDCVLGVTSQLSRIKGVDGIIRVFAKIWNHYPNCYLVITGEGAERPNLESLTKDLGISERVVFAGFSKDPLLTAATYDIAISNSQFEGFPNTVVEYFAAAKPVVTTDAGGVPEMVRHGYNGLIFPCGEEEKLYENLLRLLRDPSLQETLKQNARQTILEKFSEDIMLDNLETFFNRVVREFKKN